MACALLSASVCIIASTSIGLECGNSTDYKTKKKDNFNFLIALVVSGILCLLCSFGGIYMGVQMPV
jgi:hypothetical protein